MLVVVDHGQQRQVRAVAGAEDADPRRVDPAERAQVVVGSEAVLGVVDAPHSVVGPLEVPAVGRAAAEVEREPGVALVDEVLGDAVPFVAGVGRRAAVGIHDRRHRVVGRGRGGTVQPAVDVETVERAVGDMFGNDVGSRPDRSRSRGEQLGDLAVSDAADPRGCDVRFVDGHHRPIGQPVRRRPRAAQRQHIDVAGRGVDHHQVADAVPVAHGENPCAV